MYSKPAKKHSTAEARNVAKYTAMPVPKSDRSESFVVHAGYNVDPGVPGSALRYSTPPDDEDEDDDEDATAIRRGSLIFSK